MNSVIEVALLGWRSGWGSYQDGHRLLAVYAPDDVSNLASMRHNATSIVMQYLTQPSYLYTELKQSFVCHCDVQAEDMAVTILVRL